MEGIDWTQVMDYVAYVIAAAAAVAALTPNTWDNAVLKLVRSLVDALALNVGNAKNAD
jgi:hypothetical protein